MNERRTGRQRARREGRIGAGAVAVAVAAAALAGAPARGQGQGQDQRPGAAARDLAGAVERLEGEGAVLRWEVEAARARLGSLDAAVRALEVEVERLIREATMRASSPAPAGPHLSADGATIVIPDFVVLSSAGAATPEDLARRVVAQIAALQGDEPGLATGGFGRRRSAFFSDLCAVGPDQSDVFPIPADLWSRICPAERPELPVYEEMSKTLDELYRPLHLATVSGLYVRPAAPEGPAACRVIEVAASGPRGSDTLTITAASVHGRWLVARIHAKSFEMLAQTLLERMLMIQEARRRAEGEYATSYFELLEVAEEEHLPWVNDPPLAIEAEEGDLMRAVRRELGGDTASGPRMLWRVNFLDTVADTPLYRVELRGLPGGEWAAVATPQFAGYPVIEVGPLPDAPPGQPRWPGTPRPYTVRVRSEEASR